MKIAKSLEKLGVVKEIYDSENEKYNFYLGEDIASMFVSGLITFAIAMLLGFIFSIPFMKMLGNEFGFSFRIIFILIVVLLFSFASSHNAGYKTLLVLVVFGKRLPVFFSEGFWFLVFIKPFIKTEPFNVREMTLGVKEKKDKSSKTEYETIKSQTRDDVEASVEYAMQVGILNPIRWFDAEEPLEAIQNKLLSQLRIIISLFNAGDINQLKGVITGMLYGQTYAVQRLADGFLLKDRAGNVIVIDINEAKKEMEEQESSLTLEEYVSGKIKNQASGIKSFKDSDNQQFTLEKIKSTSIEIIPPKTFKNGELSAEVKRVGAYMKTPSIRDVTPPEEIRKAGEKLQKERLERQAREEETRTHVSLALIETGMNDVGYKNKVDPDNKNEAPVPWDEKDWLNFEKAKAEIRVREETAQEIIVRHIGSKGGSSELGGSVVASQAIKK